MHLVHIGLAPSYLREWVTASADVTSRPRLRSTNSQRYEQPRIRLKFGERSFSCAGPRAWITGIRIQIDTASPTQCSKSQNTNENSVINEVYIPLVERIENMLLTCYRQYRPVVRLREPVRYLMHYILRARLTSLYCYMKMAYVNKRTSSDHGVTTNP